MNQHAIQSSTGIDQSLIRIVLIYVSTFFLQSQTAYRINRTDCSRSSLCEYFSIVHLVLRFVI